MESEKFWRIETDLKHLTQRSSTHTTVHKMGKGAVKFGGKSGYLPKPRAIFKTPIYEIEKLAKTQLNTGYLEGVKHPKGTSREQKPLKFVSLQERIELTAREPQKQYSAEDRLKLPLEQQIRLQNSDLRRNYLRESYLKEAERIKESQLLDERHKEEARKLLEQRILDHEESQAFKLTIPSIEQYLTGPIMRQRTAEEKQALQQKRTANRLHHELISQQEKLVALLELYNSAASFITTEEQLNKLITQAFDKPSDDLKNSEIFNSVEDNMLSNLDALIRSSLLGNTANDEGPSLRSIQESLNGEEDELMKLAMLKIESNKQLEMLKTQLDIDQGKLKFFKNL